MAMVDPNIYQTYVTTEKKGQPLIYVKVHTRADHGGAGGTVQLRPAPGGKYPHFRGDIPGG